MSRNKPQTIQKQQLKLQASKAHKYSFCLPLHPTQKPQTKKTHIKQITKATSQRHLNRTQQSSESPYVSEFTTNQDNNYIEFSNVGNTNANTDKNEISQINDDQMSIYLHKIEIDYGKLQKPKQTIGMSLPAHSHINRNTQNFTVQASIVNQLRQIKRKVLFNQNDSQTLVELEQIKQAHKNIAIADQADYVHSKTAHKKSLSLVSKSNPTNPQAKLKPRKWPLNVKSYAYLNRSLDKQKLRGKGPEPKQQAYEQEPLHLLQTPPKAKYQQQLQRQKQCHPGSQLSKSQSNKRHTMSHSRIIKVANPTAGIQTKIYTYDFSLSSGNKMAKK